MPLSRILITGGAGQVGLELRRLPWPDHVEILFPARSELDLNSDESIGAYLDSNTVDCIVNCAAWTAVDAAEDRAGEAFMANAQGAAWLADHSRRLGLPMIQVSTDYVFSGVLDRPYREDDAVGPTGVYGASKLAGELAVRSANPRSVVLRVAWVVSAQRNNFLKTMLRLGAERDQLSVVEDQRGCPTGARDIAQTIRTIALRLLDDPNSPCGTYHFVNGGEASWFDLASYIFECASRHGGPAPAVSPISSDKFPTKARRPANSRLDTAKIAADYDIHPRPWREAVREIVDELLAAPPIDKE